MIITVTLNPAVDISYRLDRFSIDTTNRVADISKTAGGKGLNVARVVKQLGEEVGASGFLGGSLGDFIRKQLHAGGIDDHFVKIDGETRNCIAILHEGKQTEILENGPTISSEEQTRFLSDFEKFTTHADIVTVSGSLPAGLDGSFYKSLIALCAQNGKRAFLDTGGSLLKEVLQGSHQPFLIKPNEDEFAELVGKDKITDDEIIQELSSGLFRDVEWVVVTLGSRGAIIKHDNNIYLAKIPSVKVMNPVGSGDSVIAGFATALHRNMDAKMTIAFGLTMGVLNAMEETTGHINVNNIRNIQEKIYIEKVHEL